MDDSSSVPEGSAPEGSAPEGSVPRGLVFFSPGATPAYRRRRIIAWVIFAIGLVSMIWPVAALVAGPRPLVLGMPLHLAWLALWIAIVFLTLLWLYRSEPAHPSSGPSIGSSPGPAHDPQ